jgi:hypothetical protein
MDPLDRHIEELVNADPSPEFVARVRARVATAGTPARWRISRSLVAAAVLATLAMAVWVVRVDRVPGQAPLVARVAVPLPPRVHAGDARVSTPVAAPLVPTTRARRQPRAQVIVASDEVQGLRQLADLVRDGHVVLSFADGRRPEAVEMSPLKEIVVAPIDIAPLTIASSAEQGDEQ